mgnify:CR=1 FL=1
MASFQKRGKTWQYTISRMVDGKSKPIRKGGFKTKKEAQVEAAEVEARLNKGIHTKLEPKPFDEYFLNWVELYKTNVSDRTMKHYKHTHKAIERYFGGKAIQDITRNEYQSFINDYGSTRAKETVEKLHAHVRSCVLDAIEDQVIPFDFTRKATLTWTTPAKKASEKHLNYHESEQLLRALRSKLEDGLGYYLLLLGLTSGLRYGELVGLTRNDFDFVNNTINIDKTWGYMSGKAGFGPTKNESSVRKIKIDKPTMKAFEKLFQNTPNNINRLVFYSPQSKYKVISNNNANKLLRKILGELDIDPPITTHGLRHTHASVLIYKKVSVNYVSERLGHKDIETTLKTYAHVLNEMRIEDENETINVFESMLV